MVRVEPAATALDWSLIKGDSFDLVLPVLDELGQPVALAGWSAKAQIRRHPDDPLLHEWSAAWGNVTVGATSVTLHVDGPVTALWEWSIAHVSVEVTDLDGLTHTIARGTVRALDEVTR